MEIKNKKKVIIVLLTLLGLFLGWYGYQNSIPKSSLYVIKSLEGKEEIVRIFNAQGIDITEEFYETNRIHYKMHNWKFIYNYFKENVTGMDRSRDFEWIQSTKERYEEAKKNQ